MLFIVVVVARQCRIVQAQPRAVGGVDALPHDGRLLPDNNWVENRARSIALGRSNWLFASSQHAGQRAAAVMSLVHSTRLNGHDLYSYLRDVLERLST